MILTSGTRGLHLLAGGPTAWGKVPLQAFQDEKKYAVGSYQHHSVYNIALEDFLFFVISSLYQSLWHMSSAVPIETGSQGGRQAVGTR